MKTGLINILITFIISICIAPFVIKFLKKLKCGQSILVYVEKHKGKSGTPTMGGIIFIISTCIGYLIFFNSNNTISTIAILSLLFFGVLGFLDDYIKIKFEQNEGLKPYQKIIGQIGISVIIAIYIYMSNLVGTECYIPFTTITFDLGYFAIPLVIVVYLAVVNSVNLIDGLDGLCGGVSFVVIFVFSVILSILSVGFDGVYLSEVENLITSSLGLCGALLGFLCFNSHPAKVFMGDTGSLALGGFIASMTVLTKNYFLIVVIGFMYVLTALSVILQVSVYKLTHKRIFKMAPLHHHFEQISTETKVVSIYIIVTILLGMLTIFIYL